tara:strand:+ start:2204 stop:2683 length:480 start_codon:yes stop_codon:yes gene_type:complete
MNKYSIIFSVLLFSVSNIATARPSDSPNSFDLVCDTVDVIGYSLGKDRISQSYVKWDKHRKSLTIKSEELSEFHDELNPSYSNIYTSNKDFGDSQRVFLTFKAKSFAEKWEHENSTRFVSAQIDLSPKTKGALLKLTEFWQTGGVISMVETKQARCKIR